MERISKILNHLGNEENTASAADTNGTVSRSNTGSDKRLDGKVAIITGAGSGMYVLPPFLNVNLFAMHQLLLPCLNRSNLYECI